MKFSNVVALALLCSLSYCQDKVRVATWNLEWFSEDALPERIENVKSVLGTIKPDIIGVQEVQSLKALKQVFGDEWETATVDAEPEDQEPCIAVRKPYKIEEFAPVFKDEFYDFAFPGKRDVLRAVISAPGGAKFSVYVCHMKSRSGGRLQTDPQREMAAALLAGYISGHQSENTIVLGDMNDAPDDRSMNILESGDLLIKGGENSPGRLLVNLCDPLYRKDYVSFGLKPDLAGPVIEFSRSENERTRGIDYKYPQDLKVTQILFDQILVSPRLAEGATPKIYNGADTLRGSFGRTRKDDNGRAVYSKKGTRPSDHCPVYVDLTVPAAQ